MYITNPHTLSNVAMVSKRMGEHIIKHNKIAFLSRQGDKYIFSDTPEFKKVYESLPWFVKWFY